MLMIYAEDMAAISQLPSPPNMAVGEFVCLRQPAEGGAL